MLSVAIIIMEEVTHAGFFPAEILSGGYFSIRGGGGGGGGGGMYNSAST